MNRLPLALALVLLPALGCERANAQEIPAGVRYKTAPDAVNAAAKIALEQALAEPGRAPLQLMDTTLTCGPMLWNELKPQANAALLESKPIDMFVELPAPVIRTEGRGMITDEQRRAFWLALQAKHPNLKSAKVRRATADEIRYFWATIPFDIEEPFWTIEDGSARFVANFHVKDGTPRLFWLDLAGDLKALRGTPVEAKNGDTAALDMVEERACCRPVGNGIDSAMTEVLP